MPISARTQQEQPRNLGPLPIDASSDVGADVGADVVNLDAIDGSADVDPVIDGAVEDQRDVSADRVESDRADVPTSLDAGDSGTCPGTMSAVCGGRCVDLGLDRQHCGACGNVCLGDCLDGRCITAVRVSVGSAHTCVLASDGSVYTTGFATALGVLAGADRSSLGRVDGIVGATDVWCSDFVGCAARSGLPPLCWGVNNRFQIARTTSSLRVPAAINISTPAATTPAIDLVAIRSFLASTIGACALTNSDVFCWGMENEWSRRPRALPVPNSPDAYPIGVGAVRQIAVSERALISAAVVCALRSNDTIACWGNALEPYALMTVGTPAPPLFTLLAFPRVVTIADGLAQRDVGHVATCGIDASGVVWCGSGRIVAAGLLPPLGNGGADAPVTAEAITLPVSGPARGVAVTSDGACAIQSDNSVVCWGQPGANRATLGRRDVAMNMRYGPRPVEVCSRSGTSCAPLTRITQITSGPGHTCARSMDGEVFCWGSNNSGQLGTGDTLTRLYAVRVLW
jgi:hypothetical protein